MEKKPAVFFDRDGVLNIDHGYVYRQEDFEWMPGAIEAIKWLNNQGYLVFVVTNQSGIARGYYTEEAVHALHAYILMDLKRNNAHIDAFYYCPHYAKGTIAQYSVDCTCRKPGSGMLVQAMSEWPIDTTRSLMIGDKKSDILAAEAAGISGYLFKGGNVYDFVKNLPEVQHIDNY